MNNLRILINKFKQKMNSHFYYVQRASKGPVLFSMLSLLRNQALIPAFISQIVTEEAEE